MPIKVCHVTSVHGPYDTRIFHKMCRSLVDHGFEVYLVVANAESEKKEGVSIVGVPVPFKSRVQRMRLAAKAVFDKAVEIDAKIYHLHDPELLGYAVKLQKMGKHVIFDSHEDVPNDILDKDWLGPRFIRQAISRLYAFYEKRQVKKLSGLISVLPEITERFKHPNGITIHNYPRLESFDVPAKNFSPPESDQFKLVYNGGLTKIRGIHHLVSAMQYLNDQFSLILMGGWESEAYHEECRKLEGWKRVNYLGNVNVHECFSILKSCQLGMVLFLPVPNHLQSLPNKSFEFVAAGIPMVMSEFPFWKRFFGNYAQFVNPERPKQIAEKIKSVKENYTSEKHKIRTEGERLLQEFTWENEGKRLANYYREMLK